MKAVVQDESDWGEGGNRVLGGTGKWIHALALSPFISRKLRPLPTRPNKPDLLFIAGLVEAQVGPFVQARSHSASYPPRRESPDSLSLMEIHMTNDTEPTCEPEAGGTPCGRGACACKSCGCKNECRCGSRCD